MGSAARALQDRGAASEVHLFTPRFPRGVLHDRSAQGLLTTSRGWQTAQRPHLQVLLTEHETQMQSSEWNWNFGSNSGRYT